MGLNFRTGAHGLLILVIGASAVTSEGCCRRAADAVEYSDPHPLPAEPAVTDAPSLGRYGGRFVIGQITNPRSFNALMVNEQSSSDVTERAFVTLAEYDNIAQK